MELENIILRELGRLRMPKITCSPSYVNYRPKTNASNIIGHGSHAKGRMHRNREREGNLKLECGLCAHYKGVNKVILNWQSPLWEGDQKVAKKSGRHEPMWVAIHKCMEATLRLSLAIFISK
jgi:hypothetical protein